MNTIQTVALAAYEVNRSPYSFSEQMSLFRKTIPTALEHIFFLEKEKRTKKTEKKRNTNFGSNNVTQITNRGASLRVPFQYVLVRVIFRNSAF